MSHSSLSTSPAQRASSSPSAVTNQEIQDAIDAAGALAVNNGDTIGNAIGMISDGSGFKSCNGLRVYSSKNLVRSDTLFEIGSVTKLLTTALFGSVVSSNWFSLDDKLSRFANGALPDIPSGADLSNVTLQDLATFAAGIPQGPGVPRRPIIEWGVSDFLTWFQDAPANPGTFEYCNGATGMLGLLCGAPAPTTTALTSNAVQDWFTYLGKRVLNPLGMSDTLVAGLPVLTTNQSARLASGYRQALAEASLGGAGGYTRHVSKVDVLNGGSDYSTTPAVTIVPSSPGSASGATATANLIDSSVGSITVDDGGHYYISRPYAVIEPGAPQHNVVPVWAAAGAALSTIDDMNLFAGACLAACQGSQPGDYLYDGLRLAMQNYATSPQGPQYGMAWGIEPGPHGIGVLFGKAGGLPGFSSYLAVVPAQEIAITVLCNSRQEDPKTTPAQEIVHSVLDTLFS